MSNRLLVIHPRDRSTEFLRAIYARLDATIVSQGMPKHRLRGMIEKYDQVMMLGHGMCGGLLSVGQFDSSIFVVDHMMVPQLAERDNNIFIWCNADQFVRQNKLRGLYTGMFISEVHEAYACGVRQSGCADVVESNEAFAAIAGRVADRGVQQMHAAIKREYGQLAERNAVARYNNERIYLSEGGRHDMREVCGLCSESEVGVGVSGPRRDPVQRVADADFVSAADQGGGELAAALSRRPKYAESARCSASIA